MRQLAHIRTVGSRILGAAEALLTSVVGIRSALDVELRLISVPLSHHHFFLPLQLPFGHPNNGDDSTLQQTCSTLLHCSCHVSYSINCIRWCPMLLLRQGKSKLMPLTFKLSRATLTPEFADPKRHLCRQVARGDREDQEAQEVRSARSSFPRFQGIDRCAAGTMVQKSLARSH